MSHYFKETFCQGLFLNILIFFNGLGQLGNISNILYLHQIESGKMEVDEAMYHLEVLNYIAVERM